MRARIGLFCVVRVHLRPKHDTNKIVGYIAVTVLEINNDTLQPDNTDDAGNASKCKDDAQSNLLSKCKVQFPDDWNGEPKDEQIACKVGKTFVPREEH